MADPKKPRTALVRMRAGLQMPLPGDVVVDSPTNLCTSENPIRVLLDSRFVRNRLRCGDLELVDGDRAALGLPEAAAPEPVISERKSFAGALGGKDKE